MKRFHDPDRVRRLHETEDTWVSVWSGRLVAATGEEERDRYSKRPGYALEPAGTDPVGAGFVFLHLLEGYADLVRKLCLRETLIEPPRPDAPADFFVHRICASRPRDSPVP